MGTILSIYALSFHSADTQDRSDSILSCEDNFLNAAVVVAGQSFGLSQFYGALKDIYGTACWSWGAGSEKRRFTWLHPIFEYLCIIQHKLLKKRFMGDVVLQVWNEINSSTELASAPRSDWLKRYHQRFPFGLNAHLGWKVRWCRSSPKRTLDNEWVQNLSRWSILPK